MGKNLTKVALKGSAWISIGQIARSVIKFGLLIYLARVISPKDFGIVGASLVVISFSDIFSELGTGPALVQRKHINIRHIRVGFTLSVILGSLVAITIFKLSSQVALLFGIPEMESPLRVLTIAFPLVSISVASVSLMKRKMRYRELAIIELIVYIFVYSIVAISFASFGYGLWALIYAYLAKVVVKTILTIIIEPDGLSKPLFSLKETKELLGTGFGFTLGRISNQIANQVDNFVIGRNLGASLLGIYGRAYEFFMAPVQLLGSVSATVLFPMMSSIQDDNKRLSNAYFTILSLMAMVNIPIGFILLLHSRDFIYIALGQDWMEVVIPFQIFSLVLFFRTAYKISDALVQAIGAVYYRATFQAFYAVLIFISTWIGSRWGLSGVATGMAISISINFFIMFGLSIRNFDNGWQLLFNVLIKNLIISLIILILSWVVKNMISGLSINFYLQFIINVLVSFIIWLMVLYVSKKIYKNELKWFKNKLIDKSNANK